MDANTNPAIRNIHRQGGMRIKFESGAFRRTRCSHGSGLFDWAASRCAARDFCRAYPYSSIPTGCR